jgi:hypothetical protein
MKNIGINVQPGQVRIFLQSQGSMLWSLFSAIKKIGEISGVFSW